jgi:hypothetical protein
LDYNVQQGMMYIQLLLALGLIPLALNTFQQDKINTQMLNYPLYLDCKFQQGTMHTEMPLYLDYNVQQGIGYMYIHQTHT